MDLARYCVAARIDPSCVSSARRVLLFGRATAPRGFFRLQQSPLHLAPYQAARLLHFCVENRPKEVVADLLETFFAYARTGDEPDPEHASTLTALVKRAGVTENHRASGLVHALTWADRLKVPEMLFIACGSVPYATLVEAIEAEAAHVRRVAWTPVSI
jgi:hypothetical protein